MQIVERTVGDVTILDLNGRLVLTDGDDVFKYTINRLVQLGRRKLLLNLEGLSYIDSAGLGVMVGRYVSLRKHDGQLKLCKVRERSFEVLTVTKLLTVFENFESEAEAVLSFSM